MRIMATDAERAALKAAADAACAWDSVERGWFEAGWIAGRAEQAAEIEHQRRQVAEFDIVEDNLIESNDRLRNVVALLNSMVLSGESHSETSQRMMREALDS
jgi:hypothetical protein